VKLSNDKFKIEDFDIGVLVTYSGPPITKTHNLFLISKNDSGVISSTDIGIITKTNTFLCVCDILFQQYGFIIERISMKYLKIIIL